MTPYEIGIVPHYYCRACDHPDISNNPPIWRPTVDSFVTDDLLTMEGTEHGLCYRLTDRGFAYAHSLMQVPLPTHCWVTEWPDSVERAARRETP